MKLIIALFCTLFLSQAFAARTYLYKTGGADIAADNVWRTSINQTFTVTANTVGTVLITIPFTNTSCTGNSASCSPSKMATGQIKATLRDNTGYLHDQETIWVDNSVVLNPNGAVTSILVKNSGPYTLHLTAQDMRAGTYTLTVELMAVGGLNYRPVRHNGIKATVIVY